MLVSSIGCSISKIEGKGSIFESRFSREKLLNEDVIYTIGVGAAKGFTGGFHVEGQGIA
jgi:hypothetical protein